MMQYGSNCNISSTDNDNSIQPSELEFSLWSKMESTTSIKKSVRLTKQETRDEALLPNAENPVAEHEPDTRLENWKRWLDVHKEQQDKLSNILKRPPECLLMNMNFNSLYVNQQKKLITEASAYQFCDKYRGHPCFWTTDGGAHSGNKKLGIYQPIQKRYDRSQYTAKLNWSPKATELEYVGVPDVILKEKGLSGESCLPLPKDNWDMSYYVCKKKEGLNQKIDIFQEHMPESEELAVVGSKLTRTDESQMVNFEKDNTLVGSQYDDIYESPFDSENSEGLIGKTISVSIEDKIVDNSLKVWNICFEDCVTDEFYQKNLTIHNLNDCCLRYSWEAVLPTFLNSPLPLRRIRNNKSFYFNKNDAVILPNSSTKLTFYFHSGKAGIFYEKWNLHLSNAPDKEELMTVELQAVVSERPEIEDRLKSVDSYIDSCVRYTIASKTVKELLERRRPERPRILPYDWMFFEEQIFLFNNPDLFYETKQVSFLKEIYKRICEGPWDFSIQTLREKLLEKTLNEDITETVNEFTAIVCYLMKPKLNYSFTNEKHKSVYELLCCFIEKMEKESNSLKCILKIPLKIASSLNTGDKEIFKTIPRTSKLNSKVSKTSKKSTLKESKRKVNFLSVKSLSVGSEETSLLRQSLHIGDSNETLSDELEEKIKKEEYLKALYNKTYNHLCTTVENIAAVIDSFDTQKKRSALLALKTNITYNNFN